MKRFYQTIILMLGLTCIPSWLYAGILASQTRVIYSEGEREQTLMLANTNEYPILTQVWIDDGSNNAEFEHAPFVVLPAVFQMKPKDVKGIRLIFNGMELAKDRESIYWLNLYEIPAVKKQDLEHDYLNLSMNTQLKVYFRPEALKVLPIDEINRQLQFSFSDHRAQSAEIIIKNPTPFYVTAISLSLFNKTKQTTVYEWLNILLPPFESPLLKLENVDLNPSDAYVLKYHLIDDRGEVHAFEQAIPISK